MVRWWDSGMVVGTELRWRGWIVLVLIELVEE